MRWINRAVTAFLAVAIVVGPPLAITLWIRAERWRFPTGAQVLAWIEQPLNGGAVAALIGAVAVSVWLLLVFAIVHRTWYAILGKVRWLRRRPLPTAAQMTAGSMAGVAALAMPSVVVHHPGGAAPVSAPANTALPGPEVATAQAGIDLPGGGWVPYRTALAVTLLGGAIWLHRRQHYQPRGPRLGQHHDDADLHPLPATAEAIMARTSTDDPPSNDLTPGSVLLPDLPTGLITLHGPGAMNAARGLLVTTILNTALGSAPHTVVTVRPHDLELVLGARVSGDIPQGLHIEESPGALDARGVSGGNADRAGSVTLSLTWRAARTPDSERAVGRVGDGDDPVTVVVVDDDSREGRRWYVAADGSITGSGSSRVQRLCVLDVRAATDLLLLVRYHVRAATPTVSRAAEPVAPPEQPPRPGKLMVLGSCRLHVDGSTVHIRRSAGLQVLAYLAIHPDGATTSDLIRAIWPGLNPSTITKRLHTTLTDLRQQLQPTLDDVIIRHDDRYRLNPDVVSTDLHQLRQAITAATTAVTGQQIQAAAQAIIDAYPGELAAGFSWPWLQRHREALRRDVIDAYLQLASTAPPAQALDLVRAATTVDPYNEALHEQAQRILEAVGEQDAAQALRRGLAQRLLTAGLATSDGGHRQPGAVGR